MIHDALINPSVAHDNGRFAGSNFLLVLVLVAAAECLATQQETTEAGCTALVRIRCTTTLVNNRQVYHPEAHMTGIYIAEEGIVLCSSFLRRVQPAVVGEAKISFVRYYLEGDQDREAQVLYEGARFCLLDFGHKPSTPSYALDQVDWAPHPFSDIDHVRLIKAGSTGPQVAIAHVCRSHPEPAGESRFIVSACPFTRDWLGALCLTTGSDHVVGILASFRTAYQANSIYDFNLNGISMNAAPDGLITSLRPNDIECLLRHQWNLRLSTFEWMGITCREEDLGSASLSHRCLRIVSVELQSLAERQGLLAGDRITHINRRAIPRTNGFALLFLESEINRGGAICLDLLRDGEAKSCMTELPSREEIAPFVLEAMGLTLECAYPPDENLKGFRILDTATKTRAYIPDLQVDDVILRVNGKGFTDREELSEAVGSLQGRAAIELLRGREKRLIIGEIP